MMFVIIVVDIDGEDLGLVLWLVHRVHFEVRHCNREVGVNDENSVGCRSLRR